MKSISFLIILTSFVASFSSAQILKPDQYQHLKWRCIGPHRGGRTVGAVGIPDQPNVFYIGVNNGGVWKTNDFGRTWKPIFDDQPTGSIGDVVIAPSNPNTIYVGTGEGLQRPDLSVGNGIYKSTNAGQTWVHCGLDKVQQVGGLAVDPKNEEIIYVAALGKPYGPNQERGIYKSTKGGKNWEHILFIDENTGAIQISIDPNNSDIIFADMWAARLAPWENGMWNGKNSGLYKSMDGGKNWKKITKGLPTTEQGLGRIGFCIAPSDSRRMYASVDAGEFGGIYRSDDSGESWYLINNDGRLWGRGSDFAEVKVDPMNPDIVYSANVVTWKSEDGGKTWNAFRGAPGGDDYHRIWINPVNPKIILIASDQGAIITVNGGETFSSWYNQATAQFYHVSADNDFPYNVYSGQQESGSVGISSRGNDGQITFREWHPVGAEEYGYVVADPKNPNIVYGGKISRHDKRTGQTQNISPEFVRSGKYRFLRTAPIIFSPIDHTTLYFAGNVLFSSKDGGDSWKTISPDLSRSEWEVPKCVGIFNEDPDKYTEKGMARRGVIYTVAPSYKNKKIIWCGTDDGLIHITKDGGKTWQNVTPPQITSWYKISLMDASHSNPLGAYVAVNGIRTDDLRPHIYKTENGGKTWKLITNGLMDNQPINVVKEDPKQSGLLFAGSETQVSFSLDDGEHWQSLRLNMPATSIRDLCIKGDDLIVGTHGRSFWILDNINSLRNLAKKNVSNKKILLYPSSNTYRVRWNMNTDTPLPQEEPAGENPPDGAMIEYYLSKDVNQLKIEILDENQNTIRSYTYHDTLYHIPNVNIPLYWIRPQQIPNSKIGSHRFLWDLHYAPLNIAPSYPIAAIYKNTEPNESSPYVKPGIYTIRITADHEIASNKLKVLPDPRVSLKKKDYELIQSLALKCYRKCQWYLEVEKIFDSAQSDLEDSKKHFNNLLALMRVLQDSDHKPTKALQMAIKKELSESKK